MFSIYLELSFESELNTKQLHAYYIYHIHFISLNDEHHLKIPICLLNNTIVSISAAYVCT